MTTNEHSESTEQRTVLTPVLTWLFFFSFNGPFYLFAIFWGCIGFPWTEIMGLPAFKIPIAIQMLAAPLYAYAIYRVLRSGSPYRFIRLSWPLIILWIIVCYRFYTQSIEIGGHAWFTRIFVAVLPMVALSIPMNASTLQKGFKVIYGTMVIFGIVSVLYCFPYVLRGISMRSVDFIYNPALASMLSCLWEGDTGGSILTIGPIGMTIGLLALWLWCHRKISFYFCLPLYVLGAILLFFSGSRLPFAVWGVMHCIIIGFYFKHFLFRKHVVCLLLLICVSGCVFWHFDRYDPDMSLSKRLFGLADEIKTLENIEVAVEEPKEISVQTVKPAKSPINITKQEITSVAETKEKLEVSKSIDYVELGDIAQRNGMDARMYIYFQSFKEGIKYPFGSRFLVPIQLSKETKLFDPHSSFFKIFLGTGYVGTLLYIYIILKAMICSWILFYNKSDQSWIAVMFLSSFLVHTFNSIDFWGSSFWCLIVLLNSEYLKISKNKGIASEG